MPPHPLFLIVIGASGAPRSRSPILAWWASCSLCFWREPCAG